MTTAGGTVSGSAVDGGTVAATLRSACGSCIVDPAFVIDSAFIVGPAF